MIGNTIGLQLKRRWIERPLLWTAYVVKPGRGKTPGIDQATAPLMKIFSKLLKEYKTLLEDTPESKRDRLDPLQRLIVNDITWEALAKLLAGNPHADSFGNKSVWHFFGEPEIVDLAPRIPAGLDEAQPIDVRDR